MHYNGAREFFAGVLGSVCLLCLVPSDFTLSSGWGNTPSPTVTVTAGSTDSMWTITFTTGSVNLSAAPTIMLTFRDGAWVNSSGVGTPPFCMSKMVFTGASGLILTGDSATSTACTVTLGGSATSGKQYTFTGICMGAR